MHKKFMSTIGFPRINLDNIYSLSKFLPAFGQTRPVPRILSGQSSTRANQACPPLVWTIYTLYHNYIQHSGKPVTNGKKNFLP